MNSSNGLVLLVDDDPNAMAWLASILVHAGYQVQPADNGTLALSSVATQPPELVLLSLTLAGMSGFEVCRRIKETEQGRRIPILFTSPEAEIGQYVEGFALGAADFICKPFRKEILLARLSTHMQLGRLQAQSQKQLGSHFEFGNEQFEIEVAKRHRAEGALQESEQRFRQIANVLPVTIWTSDRNHHVDFRNDYARKFVEQESESHSEDFVKQATRRDHMEAHEAFQLEHRQGPVDGEYRWLLEKGIPRFLPGGEFAGYVGIAIDVTDVKLGQERSFMAKNLENLRVLSAGIVHDFNTLIGAILGETDLALSDMPLDSPGRDAVERIEEVAKRAADVIRLFLAYAENPSHTATPLLIDINTVVGEIVHHLKVPAKGRCEIHTALDPRVATIQAQPLQVRQVVLNLILNALEAIAGKPGVLTVSTSPQEIEADPNLASGLYVKLVVSDTGTALAPEVLEQVFDPYFSAKVPVRGLGLASVQSIVHSNRGRFTRRSTPGQGSVFEVLWPAAGRPGL